MRESLHPGFLPKGAKFLPGARAISVALRTLHLAAFGLLLGGHAFAIEAGRLLPYLYITTLSGFGLIVLELRAVGLYWLFMGKGIAVLAKLAILFMIPFLWEVRVVLLLMVVGIASVGSHMPGRYRHYSLLHRRVIPPEEFRRRGVPPLPKVAVPDAGLDDGRPAIR